MTDDEIRSALSAIGEDGRDTATTLGVLGVLRHRQRRRRQTASLLSAAAAVVAVVLVISSSVRGIAAPHPVLPPPPVSSMSSLATPPRTTADVTSSAEATTSSSRPAVSRAPSVTVSLAAFAPQNLTSPVTTRAIPNVSMEWRLQPGNLTVAWRSEASFQNIRPTNQPDVSRGYVITTSPTEQLVDQASGNAVPTTTTAAAVNGHPASSSTAPKGAVDDQGYPARYRLSWQLPDHRWIHVFDTDFDATTTSLQQFAESLQNTPSALPRTIFFTQAPKGYRIVQGQVDFYHESLSLCASPEQTDTAKCFTLSAGEGDGASDSSLSIVPNGDTHDVRNGTLYLELAKNQAQIFLDSPPSGAVVMKSPVSMTAAQFTAIAETITVKK